MANYLDYGFDTFLRVKIQKVGVIDTVYVPAISSEITVDTSSVSAESVTSVYLNNDGLKVKDTDATHGLTIQPGSNLTADRTLTLTTGDAARTLDLVASSTGTILRANGTNWVATTLTMPDTAAISTLLYASAANVISALATGNSSVLVTSGTGVPSLSTDIPTAVTIGSAYIYRTSGTDVPVTDGGTGASTLTGLIKGNGTSAFTAVTAPSGDVVGTTDTQTLSGKTLTQPRIVATGYIADGNGDELLVFGSALSPVNAVKIFNSATNNAARVEAFGSDTNVNLSLLGQGTGVVTMGIDRQDNTTNSVLSSRIQYGWGFINNDGTTTSTKTVTFPVAFSAAPVVLIACVGELSGSDPTVISDLTTFPLTDSLTSVVAAKAITTSNFVAEAQRTPASSGVRTGYSWIAIG